MNARLSSLLPLARSACPILLTGMLLFATSGCMIRAQDVTDLMKDGQAYNLEGDFPNAIQSFSKAIDLAPNNPEIYFMRGKVYREIGEQDKAEADFRKAVSLAPDQPGSNFELGLIQLAKNEPADAIRLFDKSLEGSPQPDAYLQRGIAEGKLGNWTEAIHNFEKVVELEPGNTEAYYQWGIAERELGHTALAIAAMDAALHFDPQFAEAYYERGLLYQKQDEAAKAKADLETAKKLGYPPAK